MARRPRPERRPLPAGFGTIWTTVAIDLLGFGIILPVLPIYAERFDASPTQIGLLVASFSLAQFACAPLLGRWSDRVGRKPVLLVSLVGTAVGSLLTGVANALPLLFVGRILDGASGASVSVAQGAVTDLAGPQERPRLLGLLGAAFGVGFVLGPAVGGLASLVGPRVPFFVAAALAAANAVVAAFRLPETRRPAAVASSAAPLPPLSTSARRLLARLAVVAFVAGAAFAGFEATFALLTQERFGLGEAGVAFLFVVIGIALVLVQGGLVYRVTARLGAATTLRAGLAGNAVGLLALAAATSWPLLLVAVLLLVVGQGLVAPALSTVVANTAPDDRRGSALGVQQSAGALARVIGPAAAGALFQHVGIAAPYLVGAALVGVALLVLLSLPAAELPLVEAPSLAERP